MKEIVRLFNFLFCINILEYGFVLCNLHQIMLESYIHIICSCHLLQCLTVFRNSKHNSPSFNVFDIDGMLSVSPFIRPKIKNLLWCSCTFYWQNWFSKNGFSFLKFLAQFSCFFRVLVIVNGAHIRLGVIKQFFCTFDFVPVMLVACRNDEFVVVELMALIGNQNFFDGIDFDNSFLGPVALFWNNIFHFFATDLRLNHIESNHGPAGLVIMVLSWFEDSDVCGSDIAPQEMRSCIKTACTTSNDAIFSVMEIEHEQSFPDIHILFLL